MEYKSEYPGVIHFEKKGRVALLTFDNPKTLNALNPDTFASINLLFGQMEEDPETKKLIDNNVACGVCKEGYTNKPF